MYTLRVFRPGEPIAAETHSCSCAADVMDAIPALLERHAGCERIDVFAGTLKLFSVDCEGNRRPA